LELTLTNILLLLSSGLGLFLSVLIFHKYGQSLANRLLAILLFLYTLILLRLFLWDLMYFLIIPHFLILPISISFLMGPMHFLYTKYLINSERKFQRKDWLHFIPFILYTLFTVKDLFKSKSELISILNHLNKETVSNDFILFNWVITFHVLLYLVVSLKIIKKYSNSIPQVFSSIDKIKLNWLRYITIFIGAGIIIFLIENTFMLGGYQISEYFGLSNVIFCFYVIALGYFGLLKSEIFISSDFSESVHEFSNLPFLRITTEYEKAKRYEKSGLSKVKADDILRGLLDLMNSEKPYIESGITLNKLAKRLAVSPHNLSEVINTKLNQNFYDFINQYRIEEVKNSLSDPAKVNYTLLSIAMDAGFNSKSTFNNIFKKHTGTTPSEFRKQK